MMNELSKGYFPNKLWFNMAMDCSRTEEIHQRNVLINNVLPIFNKILSLFESKCGFKFIVLYFFQILDRLG